MSPTIKCICLKFNEKLSCLFNGVYGVVGQIGAESALRFSPWCEHNPQGRGAS